MKMTRVLLALLLGVGSAVIAGTFLDDKQAVEAKELSLAEMDAIQGGLCYQVGTVSGSSSWECYNYESVFYDCATLRFWWDLGTETCNYGYGTGYTSCTLSSDGAREKQYDCDEDWPMCGLGGWTGNTQGTKYKAQTSGACTS